MARFQCEDCLLRQIPTVLAREHVRRHGHTVVMTDA